MIFINQKINANENYVRFTFYELRVKYNIERAENEAKQSKLELLQKEKNMQWLLFFLIAIMIASILLYYLYYRKQKLYKAIVRQNKEAIRREHQLKEQIVSMKSVQETTSNEHLQTKYASSSLNEEKKNNLFEALEKLMTEDHIYTDNLLTKDKVAELQSKKNYTKFEDLPEDYACPLCAVGKDMFSEAE